MNDRQSTTEPLDEQAADWLRVLQDEPTREREAEFLRWTQRSPQHVREFLLAQEVERRLQRSHQTNNIDVEALITRSKQERRSNRRRQWSMRIAASVAILGLLSAAALLLQSRPDTYTTTADQQLIDLKDGSVVALNALSTMRVSFSTDTRDLYLDSGQAIFRVRQDADRPFRVHVGATVVEAIGTQFDVRVEGGQTTVAVVEGLVQLRSDLSEQVIRIAGGQSVTVRQDGRTDTQAQVDVAAVTAWRQPAEQLEFKNQTLADIATAFNRHNATPKLRIEGEELRERRFILVFKNADPGSLLNYLSRDEALEFVREGDDILIRERER